jgi:transcriptional regulator with XRE-family HTH domain
MNRELRSMTQKQLAGAANVSPGLIAQLEAGKVQPSLKTIESLSKVLGVSVCYLILEQEDVEGIIGGISPELRELLYNPRAQMLIGNICTMDIKEIKLVLNFIGMLKNPAIYLPPPKKKRPTGLVFFASCVIG